MKSSLLAPTIDEKLRLFVNSVMAYETIVCSIDESKDVMNRHNERTYFYGNKYYIKPQQGFRLRSDG